MTELVVDEAIDSKQNTKTSTRSKKSTSKFAGATTTARSVLHDDDTHATNHSRYETKAFGYNQALPSFMVGHYPRIRRLGENGKMEDISSDTSDRSSRSTGMDGQEVGKKGSKKKGKSSKIKKRKNKDPSISAGGATTEVGEDESSANATPSEGESDSASTQATPRTRNVRMSDDLMMSPVAAAQQNLLCQEQSPNMSSPDDQDVQKHQPHHTDKVFLCRRDEMTNPIIMDEIMRLVPRHHCTSKGSCCSRHLFLLACYG